MTNEMNHVHMNVSKDGNFSIDCSQETALNLINQLINRKQVVTVVADKPVEKVDRRKKIVEVVPTKNKSNRTMGRWTETELAFIIDNMDLPRLFKSPVLKMHTRNSVDSMKSKIKTKAYSDMGLRTGNLVKKLLQERLLEVNDIATTDYLNDY